MIKPFKGEQLALLDTPEQPFQVGDRVYADINGRRLALLVDGFEDGRIRVRFGSSSLRTWLEFPSNIRLVPFKEGDRALYRSPVSDATVPVTIGRMFDDGADVWLENSGRKRYLLFTDLEPLPDPDNLEPSPPPIHSPTPQLSPGTTITTSSGAATVTGTQILPCGETIIYANYGNGDQPHIEEGIYLDHAGKPLNVGDRVTPSHSPGKRTGVIVGFTKPRRTPVLVEWELNKPPGKWGAAALLKVISQDNPDRPIGQQDKRRQPPTGWIEERKANPKRTTPSTCYYFCWYEVTDGERRKLKTYVPVGQMSEIWQSVKVDKRPYSETLSLIRKQGKPHHTHSPKI